MKYIIEKLDETDKIIKFDGELEHLNNYTIDIDDISHLGIGGVELLVYSFFIANAGWIWEDLKDGRTIPTGRIFMEIGVFDLVKATGCSALEIRNALFVLNEAQFIRVAEVEREYGKRYVFHATA